LAQQQEGEQQQPSPQKAQQQIPSQQPQLPLLCGVYETAEAWFVAEVLPGLAQRRHLAGLWQLLTKHRRLDRVEEVRSTHGWPRGTPLLDAANGCRGESCSLLFTAVLCCAVSREVWQEVCCTWVGLQGKEPHAVLCAAVFVEIMALGS
jgi:hypothetical protein